MEAQDIVLDSDPAKHHKRLCMSLNGILITVFEMLENGARLRRYM